MKKKLEMAMNDIDHTLDQIDANSKFRRSTVDYSRIIKPAKRKELKNKETLLYVSGMFKPGRKQRIIKGSPSKVFPDIRVQHEESTRSYNNNDILTDPEQFLKEMQQKIMDLVGQRTINWDEISLGSFGNSGNQFYLQKKALQTQIYLQRAIEELTKQTQLLLKKMKLAKINKNPGIKIKNIKIVMKD